MYKIQLQNGEFFKNKSARVQHYKSNGKAAAKIEKLGEIAAGAIVVESKARTAAVKIDKLEEIVTETKVEKVRRKKSAAKAKKTNEGTIDEKGRKRQG